MSYFSFFFSFPPNAIASLILISKALMLNYELKKSLEEKYFIINATLLRYSELLQDL